MAISTRKILRSNYSITAKPRSFFPELVSKPFAKVIENGKALLNVTWFIKYFQGSTGCASRQTDNCFILLNGSYFIEIFHQISLFPALETLADLYLCVTHTKENLMLRTL